MSVTGGSASCPSRRHNRMSNAGQLDLASGEWLEAADLMGMLAHRYPFLLVDRIRVVTPGRLALGVKRVTSGEWLGAASTLPDPEMPGMLVVEALAQTSVGVLLGLLDGSSGALGYF